MFNKKQSKKNVVKKDKVEENISEEEMQKMLGNSDNSDIDSEEFSEEENMKSVEAKVNKKRKLESDDSDMEDLKKKKSKTDEINLCEESNDDDDDEEEDDDEEMEDDSFIDDDEEEEEKDDDENDSDEESETDETVDKETKKEEQKEIKKPKIVLSDSMKEEVKKRIEKRKNNSLALFNLPYKYNSISIKQLIPNLVSAIIPYDLKHHRPKGIAYVEMVKKEDAEKCIKEFNEKLLEGRKIKAFPLTKVNECIDDYDCSKLVVSNLSSKITIESLTKVLSNATDIKLVPLKKVDRRITRIAFAEYSSVEDALRDLDDKHGTEIDGLPINIHFCEEKNRRNKENITKKSGGNGKKVVKAVEEVKTNGKVKNNKRGYKKVIKKD